MEVNHKYGPHRLNQGGNQIENNSTDKFLRRSRGAPSGFHEMSLKAKVERELHEAKKGKQKSIEREYIAQTGQMPPTY
jgi:hypothetical protein